MLGKKSKHTLDQTKSCLHIKTLLPVASLQNLYDLAVHFNHSSTCWMWKTQRSLSSWKRPREKPTLKFLPSPNVCQLPKQLRPNSSKVYCTVHDIVHVCRNATKLDAWWDYQEITVCTFSFYGWPWPTQTSKCNDQHRIWSCKVWKISHTQTKKTMPRLKPFFFLQPARSTHWLVWLFFMRDKNPRTRTQYLVL